MLMYLMDILAIFRMPLPYIGNSYIVDILYIVKFSLISTILIMLGRSMAQKREKMRERYPPLRLNINGGFVNGDNYD